MKIADELAIEVMQAQIRNVDHGFLNRIDALKAYAGNEIKPEFKVLIDGLLRMYDDAMLRGIPRERAVAVMLGTHDDMLRYVITEAIKKRLGHLSIEQMDLLQLGEKKQEMQKDIKAMEDRLAAGSSDKSLEQFAAYLRYAAAQWGTLTEKKTVESLIKKIKIPAKA